MKMFYWIWWMRLIVYLRMLGIFQLNEEIVLLMIEIDIRICGNNMLIYVINVLHEMFVLMYANYVVYTLGYRFYLFLIEI